MRLWLLKWFGLSILTRADLQAVRRVSLIRGKEIGKLDVLRYNQRTLSPAKFKESAREFDFEALDAKYPFNPLLESTHEKATTPP